MIISLNNEMNRLVSKGMSSIYLKEPFQKNWRLIFYIFWETSLQVSFVGAPTHKDIIEF